MWPLAAALALAVPFLPQTEALCGGAAAAMVMRYWGAPDVYPDAFQPLVERSLGGIRTSALTADLERRGWTVVAGPGDVTEMTNELGRGRPVIALIEDRPGRNHYVVVLARTDGRVMLHDPARGPNREMDAARFDAAWARAERWMMLLLPGTAPVSRPQDEASADDNPHTLTACAALVQDGVERAGDDRTAARTLLMHATTVCPGESGAWRELAGVEALSADWTNAAAHAERAVALDPRDEFAWRILATARYVRHDDRAALAAWNRIGEPVVNLVDVKGLTHTRYGVIADAIDVPLKSVLTPDAMALAERRVRDVPSVAAARVTFRPGENGRAQIDAVVVERNRAPSGIGSWIRFGVDAVTARETSATFTNLTGGGDAAGATWRWWPHRPMVSAFYASPAPRALGGGVWRLDASRETQTFGTAAFEETRTRGGLTLGQWVTGRLRVTTTAAVERWSTRAADVTLGGAAERWTAGNRVRFRAEGGQAIGEDPFTTGTVSAAMRSKSSSDGVVLFAIAGYSAVTSASPASVWPGADAGSARDILLRAHPLLDDGIVRNGAFGRQLAFGTLEAQRWTLLKRMPVRIAPAAFVDIARATDGLETLDTRLHIDAGAGVRIGMPGAGVLRIDLAHGVRDGGFVVSAAWDRRWR